MEILSNLIVSGQSIVSRYSTPDSASILRADGTGPIGYAEVQWLRNGFGRWMARLANAPADTGTGAGVVGGSDLQFISRNDDGSSKEAVMTLYRSTGEVTVHKTLDVRGHKILAEAFASGWSGSVTINVRSGICVVKVAGVEKSSAPASGNTMFTIPAGYRPISGMGDAYAPVVANSAVSGGTDGLKTFRAYISYASGACVISGTQVPAASVPIYGTFVYPYE